MNDGSLNPNFIHGLTHSRPYLCWHNAKRRCHDIHHPQIWDYGARGIRMCEEWRTSFDAFWRDMQEGYADHLYLERRDNNKGYCKDNCYWATKLEQANNTRFNRILDTPKGKMTLAQASRAFNIKYTTLKMRLKYGWSVHAACTVPV